MYNTQSIMCPPIHIGANIPNAIICNTIKGRGFAFAEAKAEWHHKSNLTEDNIKKMYESLK